MNLNIYRNFVAGLLVVILSSTALAGKTEDAPAASPTIETVVTNVEDLAQKAQSAASQVNDLWSYTKGFIKLYSEMTSDKDIVTKINLLKETLYSSEGLGALASKVVELLPMAKRIAKVGFALASTFTATSSGGVSYVTAMALLATLASELQKSDA